jgi:hypothetical protein
MLLTVLALGISLVAPPFAASVDKTMLQRVYRAGDSDSYSLVVKSNFNGKEVTFSTEVTFNVNKVTATGAAVLASAKGMKLIADGKDVSGGTSPTLDAALKLDRFNMPSSFTMRESDAIYLLVAVAGYQPHVAVARGSEFPIKWTALDGGTSMDGKGKLLDVSAAHGHSVATVKTDLQIQTKKDGLRVTRFTSKFAVASGKLISSVGVVDGPDGVKLHVTVTKK